MSPSLRRHPILLQGPTSAGKTSLVAYLAAQTGHTFLRINNHEHTDLQVRMMVVTYQGRSRGLSVVPTVRPYFSCSGSC